MENMKTRILFKFIVYPFCERALKNERVKSKIVGKSSFGGMIFLTSHDYVWLLFISFLYCAKEGIVVEISKVKWVSRWKSRYHFAKVVENARINFSISPYCTPFFSRKENFKFFEVALSAVFLQWRSWLHYQCVRISTLKYCQYHSGHLLAFQKRP